MKRQIKSGMAVTVLLLLSIGIAAAIPAIPADYSGNVTINGAIAPDGTKVFAQVNKTTGYVYQTNAVSVTSGKYPILMVNVENILEDPDIGMPVRFYIQKPGENACLASPTTPFSSGPHTQDLTLVVPPCIAPLTPSTGIPPTITPATTTSPGGGTRGGGSSGGGGGGVISGEPFANILRSESRDGSLFANKPVIFSFTKTDAIHQIAVTGKENENDVSIRVETLKDTSKLVTKPAPGSVHINKNIWTNSKKIKEVAIKFRVEKDWIMSNGVNTEDIRLLRWEGDWKQLETKVLSSDDVYYYFESTSPGLSGFAISALKSETSLAAPTAAAPIGATPTKTPAVAPPPGQAISWVYILILLAVIAVAAFLYSSTRKKK